MLTNTDRDYTNGIRFTLQRIPTQPEPAQGDKPQSRSTYGFHVGHNTYTPSDITLPPSQINRADRPYAAWLYAGVYKEERRPTSEAWRYELNLGCIGPCAQGERVQTEWHEFVGAPIPQGWDAQIRNAPGVLARIEYSPRVFTSAPKVWEFLPAFTADIGNIFLRAGMEGTFRLGKIVPSACSGGPEPIASIITFVSAAPPVRFRSVCGGFRRVPLSLYISSRCR